MQTSLHSLIFRFANVLNCYIKIKSRRIFIMNYPETLRYSKSHEWVKNEEGMVVIGLTDFAQSELGDLVFVNLPEVDDTVTAGEALGDVESVKAVSDIFSPVSGTVCEINEELLDHPELINEAPYDAWLIKVKDVTDEEELITAAEYETHCQSESNG